MKIVNHDSTRLVTLFLAGGLGRLYLPQTIQMLVERYKFVASPRSIEELSADRFSFKHGMFNGSVIATFDVFNDGIVVSSSTASTVLDAFVDDLCKWMESAVGLQRVDTHNVSRMYESHLLIQSDAPLLRIMDALAPIEEMLSTALTAATNLEARFHAFGFGIATDHALIPGLKPIAFRVERKATAAFDKNLYVTAAPLPTSEHIKILERLEQLLR